MATRVIDQLHASRRVTDASFVTCTATFVERNADYARSHECLSMQGILVRHFARSAMTMFGRTRRPQLIAFGTWTAIGFALSLSAITITWVGLYGFPLSLIALVLAIRHVRVWP